MSLVKKNKKSLFYYDYLPTHWLPWHPHLKAWLLQAADPTGSQIPEKQMTNILSYYTIVLYTWVSSNIYTVCCICVAANKNGYIGKNLSLINRIRLIKEKVNQRKQI